ncbi:phosphate/phosphite/phosphonate ABC transporter substrate-binding protein [Catenovulum sp. SM1970]|uniref:phosphate/phosphite/phosphonate ABC transporter substrate-binding protein n=1 Tax=Marinifaba aquimaris TaxID=2741323 RepID=UPI001573B369|nr:phosphate/phosphite/phosphonate ABC transporter substrate-binding protein [Marinifaba aquimaris]NTS78025.1 phosphate/phosphite/phosphonate ABC transporter substrate-binding protein [Marinifaba aquimaris]
MNKAQKLAIFLLALFTMNSCVQAQELTRDETLVIGVVGTNPSKSIKVTTPLANFLAEKLHKHGIKAAKVVVTKDLKRLSKLIDRDRIDMVSESAFSANELIKRGDVELIARRWKGGVGEYHSIFFTNKQSNVNHFDDLVGRVVAFEDRDSTSAFYLPAHILLSNNYDLYEISHPRELPPKGSIGYFFVSEVSKTNGEANMMTWVHRKIVAASAFSNLDWEKEIPPPIRKDLKVFHNGEPIPRALVVARTNLAPELKSTLQQALFNAHKTEAGKAVLTRYKNTAKFDAVTEEMRKVVMAMGEKKKLVDDTLF